MRWEESEKMTSTDNIEVVLMTTASPAHLRQRAFDELLAIRTDRLRLRFALQEILNISRNPHDCSMLDAVQRLAEQVLEEGK